MAMLDTLKSIVQEVNQIAGLELALGNLVARVKKAINTDACSIYLADYERESFVLMATEGLSKEAIGITRLGFSEGIIGLVGQREEPINVANAHTHPRFVEAPEVKEDDFNAFLGTPIIHQRKVLGVIVIQQRESRFFNQEEESFLVTLSAQIATEIAHAEARGLFDVRQAKSNATKNLQGVAGSSGLATGTGFLIKPKADFAQVVAGRHDDADWEIRRYRLAIRKTQRELKKLQENLDALPQETHSIFQSYQYLLDANSLGNEVEKEINNGWNANYALKLVAERYINQFQSMEDPYIRERGSDLKDLGQRVLFYLMRDEQHDRKVPEQAILLAHEVTAAMLAEFPHQHLKGIISVVGATNSHAAILARALGIPAVMGLQDVNLQHLDLQEIILDGYSGKVLVQPQDVIRKEYRALIDEEEELYRLVIEQCDKPAETLDNYPMSLRLNIGLSDLSDSYQSSYDGVGLYRTEVPFMARERFPTEEEQALMYKQVLEAFPEKPVVMRTLDVGGDKPLPYLPVNEENPFLGWRGIRMTLDHPEIFLVQLRAMLRASQGHDQLHIMLPMITSVTEVDESLRLINQAYFEVADEFKDPAHKLVKPKCGVMIEVPAMIYQLEQIARKVDFFSIGTNDLTQYLLAVDRNNPSVANLYDAFHPAVLKALYTIIQTTQELDVPTAVCGELAGDPGGAVLLMAMGYKELSMSQHNLHKIKWVIRNIHLEDARQLLADVMRLEHPFQVRQKVAYFLEIAGLGGLVRAGK